MNKIGKSEAESIDYISRLPESVVHHILSHLDFKHIVSTCVLSKTWNRIWSNYPNVDFDFYHMHNYPEMERMMEQCLFRKDSIQNMQVTIYVPDVVNVEELAPYMDRWLRAALERNVSELVIRLHYVKRSVEGPNMLYSVPREVVIARSLRILDLQGFVIEDSLGRVVLPRLRELRLQQCEFAGENALNKIILDCHELEFLEVRFCEGVGKFLSVSSKPRFKYFYLAIDKELERIEILTPSLETFKLCLTQPCVIDLDSCVALKHMELNHVFLYANCFDIQSLLSKLLYIESLELQNCRVIDKIKISSPCLKRLVMNYYKNIPGVEFDIPNLLSLQCDLDGEFYSDNQYSSWNVPMLDEIHFMFSARSLMIFRGLKCFLEKLHCYEDLKLLIVCRDGRSYIMHEKLHSIRFRTLKKFIKRAKPECIVISSRRDQSYLIGDLIASNNPVSLHVISSSRQRIELVHESLSNNMSIKKWFHAPLRLVSTEEIEHEMNYECKSFLKSFSMGYQTASIILHKKELEEVITRASTH